MEEGKKKIRSPRLAGLISMLAAGVVLITISGTRREGVRIRDYPQLAPKAYCTVLVYMDGSNLESDYGAAAADLAEMEEAIQTSDMPDDTLRVVVEAGGTADWQYPAMQGKEYGRFNLSVDGVSGVDEMEARNMGRSDTLADFINYGVQSYPAEHYGLVFWNHGAGQIAGFGSDSNFAGESLALESIKKGVESSAMKGKFDFVSLDACLMGNLELVSVLEDKTDYFIASEELEPEHGYDYAWMEVIVDQRRNNEGNLGRTVGEAMLSTYADSYQDKDYKLTLSLIDVNAYASFHKTFHEVIEKAAGEANALLYQELGKKRISLQGFGSRRDGTVAEIVDVMDLLRTVADLGGDPSGYEKAEEQIRSLVVQKVTKGYSEEPSGLSIFLPSGSNDWLLDDMAVYDGITFCHSYHALLDGYQKYLAEENHLEWRTPTRKKKTISMQVDADTLEQIAGAYLTAFCDTGEDGWMYLLGMDSDVTIDRKGLLSAVPEDTYWGLKGQALCLIEVLNTDQCTEYMTPILYHDELCTMFIVFDEENPDGIISSITPVGVAKQEYELQDGDTVTPLYPLEQTEDADSIDAGKGSAGEMGKAGADSSVLSGKIYNDTFYKGDEISIDSVEDGDALLERIKISTDQCCFGFLIHDTKQKMYYTDFVE